MARSWTFGQKIAAGFALAFVLQAAVGVVAWRNITTLSRTSDAVAHTHLVLEHLESVLSLMQDGETGARGYVITGEASYLEPYESSLTRIQSTVKELRELTGDNPAQQRRLTQADPLIASKLAYLKQSIDLRRDEGLDKATKALLTGEGKKVMDSLRGVLKEMDQEERGLLERRAKEVEDAVSGATLVISVGTLVCLLLVLGAGLAISRSLTTQIGSAVQHMQSSSAELQTAAGQQSTGAKEQSTAMNEITTTITELLVTSRQIAESAQRVAQIADETTKGARAGEQTLSKANTSFGGIKQQVDFIVTHMLELGKKSQQIGSILEIIKEFAEQTNILAINATIEAAGAGETGKRFAVVADEIRKLADRVGGSTKEVRGLIEEIRAAVNTTVMATEGGSKAVDLGARQFSDVATAFKQIASLVSTTTEATREIELSTKQQATAVEQVKIAVSNVAQATRESEASASQTLQTASQLAALSRDLMLLVQPKASE